MIGRDKIKHTLLMIAIVIGVGVILEGYIGILGVVLGVITGLMVSVVKEMFDVFIQKDNTSKEATYDLIADLVGVSIGAIICIVCLFLR